MRDTAYKSLLDRAKLRGSVLPKLSAPKLARTLNDCLHVFTSDALGPHPGRKGGRRSLGGACGLRGASRG